MAKTLEINDSEYEKHREFLSSVNAWYYEHNFETKKIIIKYNEQK